MEDPALTILPDIRLPTLTDIATSFDLLESEIASLIYDLTGLGEPMLESTTTATHVIAMPRPLAVHAPGKFFVSYLLQLSLIPSILMWMTDHMKQGGAKMKDYVEPVDADTWPTGQLVRWPSLETQLGIEATSEQVFITLDSLWDFVDAFRAESAGESSLNRRVGEHSPDLGDFHRPPSPIELLNSPLKLPRVWAWRVSKLTCQGQWYSVDVAKGLRNRLKPFLNGRTAFDRYLLRSIKLVSRNVGTYSTQSLLDALHLILLNPTELVSARSSKTVRPLLSIVDPIALIKPLNFAFKHDARFDEKVDPASFDIFIDSEGHKATFVDEAAACIEAPLLGETECELTECYVTGICYQIGYAKRTPKPEQKPYQFPLWANVRKPTSDNMGGT